MPQLIEFLSAVLVYSENAARLANFYREVLGIPLREEQHGQTPPHYGCELGDVHFAIHPASEKAPLQEQGIPRCRLAFIVFSTASLLDRLRQHGVLPTDGPKQTSFATFTGVTDPDGNYVEFTELSDEWYEHLARRKAEGLDIVERWKSQRSKHMNEAGEKRR
jgi:hypothetical protein